LPDLLSLLPELRAAISLRLVNLMPLEDLMLHPLSRIQLRDYMESEYAAESFYFLDDVEAFHSLTAQSSNPVTSVSPAGLRARKILETYIGAKGHGAPSEVNLPAQVAEELRTALEGDSFSPMVFEQAREEISRLVTTDTLPRFFKMPAFNDLRTILQAYEPEHRFATRVERDAAIASTAEDARRASRAKRYSSNAAVNAEAREMEAERAVQGYLEKKTSNESFAGNVRRLSKTMAGEVFAASDALSRGAESEMVIGRAEAALVNDGPPVPETTNESIDRSPIESKAASVDDGWLHKVQKAGAELPETKNLLFC